MIYTTACSYGGLVLGLAASRFSPSPISGGDVTCRTGTLAAPGNKHDEMRVAIDVTPDATSLQGVSTEGSDEGTIVGVLSGLSRRRPNG